MKEHGEYTHTFYDWLYFNKFKDAVGGCVELCLAGSAPLAPHVGEFLKVAFGCPLLEGFGTTETCNG